MRQREMRCTAASASSRDSKFCPSTSPELPIGLDDTCSRQRRVSGWYESRMWRVAPATRLSYQYQRSRNTLASATKYIGMPLARASSITVGSSKRTVALSTRPSSVRSTCSCVTSGGLPWASAGTATSQASASRKVASQEPARSSIRRPGGGARCILLQHCVIETVVVTSLIVREAPPRGPGLRD